MCRLLAVLRKKCIALLLAYHSQREIFVLCFSHFPSLIQAPNSSRIREKNGLLHLPSCTCPLVSLVLAFASAEMRIQQSVFFDDPMIFVQAAGQIDRESAESWQSSMEILSEYPSMFLLLSCGYLGLGAWQGLPEIHGGYHA